jgi:antitoxin (DNA-binding transcriptional repressor) of toxin-antitoxin stability system
MRMRTVGIKELKNKLSADVRLAASGESVLVTDRDRVVAELRPRADGAASSAKAKWAEAIRRGLITPAAVKSREPPPRRLPLTTRARLMKELAGDREDR